MGHVSRSGREYSAPSAEVDAAVDALLGDQADTLKRLLELAEDAYSQKYRGAEEKALPLMRAYCEPWMVMRLFQLVRIGAIKSVASEKPAHVPGRSLPPKPFPGIVKEWLEQWGDIAPMRTADLWDRIVAMQEET